MIENRDDIRNGVEVERNDERFEVVECNGLWTKAPADANWSEAVEYISLSAGDDKTYVRTIEDFMRKFSFPKEDEEA